MPLPLGEVPRRGGEGALSVGFADSSPKGGAKFGAAKKFCPARKNFPLCPLSASFGVPSLGGIIRVAVSIFIIALGALLVEYMNDGTIYDIVILKDISAVLAILNNLSRGAMLFLFTFFAYDSAKLQLKKVKISK